VIHVVWTYLFRDAAFGAKKDVAARATHSVGCAAELTGLLIFIVVLEQIGRECCWHADVHACVVWRARQEHLLAEEAGTREATQQGGHVHVE
jgi:hypothetical protein